MLECLAGPEAAPLREGGEIVEMLGAASEKRAGRDAISLMSASRLSAELVVGRERVRGEDHARTGLGQPAERQRPALSSFRESWSRMRAMD